MNRSGLICLLLALFTVSACVDSPSDGEGQTGYVDVAVCHDTAVEIVPLTRSDRTGQLPVLLTIYDAKCSVCQVFDDFSQGSSVLELPTGNYRAVAVVGTESFEQISYAPYYIGESDFTVMPDRVASAEIVCSLATIKVTATLSEQIKANFTYRLDISNGVAAESFSNAVSEQKEIYFCPSESLTWTLTLRNAHGEEFVYTDTYGSVSAGQYYNLIFSLQSADADKAGAGEFRIVVDDSLNDPKVHDVTLVIDKSAPVIDGPDQVSKNVSDVCTDGVYVVSSALPITSLCITHSDADLLAGGLPQSIDLFADRSTLGILTDAGVSIEIFAGATPQTFVDDETTEIRLDFNTLLGKLPVGESGFTITSVNITGKDQAMDVAVTVTSSLTQPSLEPWAKFIYVKGGWISSARPQGLKLQYRLSGTEDWTDFVPSPQAGEIFYDDNSSSYRAFICALQPGASYQIRAVSDREDGAELTGTTASAGQLYNMKFDVWENFKRSNAGALEKKTWFPYPSDATDDQKVWDTANPGTSALSITPTKPEETDVVKGKAVRMESMYKSKFAAGNIYTGQFANIDIGSMGAELDWGVKFTSKPVGLKGWYKYAPKAINRYTDSYESLKGQMDKCQIQLALLTGWTGRFHIVTGDNKFVDFSTANTSVVAHNALETGTTDGKWVEFTLYAGYRKNNLTKAPNYAIISGCASYKGDYFTGGEGSILLIDEFEYIYDPMELSAQDRATFFGLFD